MFQLITLILDHALDCYQYKSKTGDHLPPGSGLECLHEDPVCITVVGTQDQVFKSIVHSVLFYKQLVFDAYLLIFKEFLKKFYWFI